MSELEEPVLDEPTLEEPSLEDPALAPEDEPGVAEEYVILNTQ